MDIDELFSIVNSRGGLMPALEAGWYDKIDSQVIRPTIRIRTVLGKYPSRWLERISVELDLHTQERKAERIDRLCRMLTSPEGVQRALQDLSEQETRALALLLQEGGWMKAATFRKKTGATEGDSWFWEEHPPTSTIGRLRARGLLAVGKMAIQNRQYRTVLVPADMRPLLTPLLLPDGGASLN